MTSPRQGELVLGIDAGNTKTVALLVRRDGTVLGAGRAPQANIYRSKKRAYAATTRAARGACEAAGVPWEGRPFGALTVSATGADWPEDFIEWRRALREWNWAERSEVVNDAVGALRAGSRCGTGVAVACGTSAGIAARAPGGAAWHTSYWQEPEGAEQLGTLALRAVYRAELGIDPPTSLTGRVLEAFGAATVEEVLHRQTGREQRPKPTGPLARLLLDEAARGDPVSRKLVLKHGADLGDYALAAARQVGLGGAYRLVTSGGVMRHPAPELRGAMLERVREVHPEVCWQPSALEPVAGAVLLALEQGGKSVDAAVFDRLASTMPPADFFTT